MLLLRTPVNRSTKEGQRLLCSEGQHVYPKTLRFPSESPAGAGPSWCSRTSLVAQTAGHASVEEVARSRLIPVDVRLVAAEVVADYGVVLGLRRSAGVRVLRELRPRQRYGW